AWRVGLAVAGRPLPWHRSKGRAGLLAFVVFGTVAAALLLAWTARLPVAPGSWHAARRVSLAFCLSRACALVESIPTTLDDNLTVPLVGAVVLPLFAQAEPSMLLADPGLGRRVGVGLAVNAVISALAFFARSIDLPAALSAIAIGTAIS